MNMKVKSTYVYPQDIHNGVIEVEYECGCVLWFHPDTQENDWRDQCEEHEDIWSTRSRTKENNMKLTKRDIELLYDILDDFCEMLNDTKPQQTLKKKVRRLQRKLTTK